MKAHIFYAKYLLGLFLVTLASAISIQFLVSAPEATTEDGLSNAKSVAAQIYESGSQRQLAYANLASELESATGLTR